MGAICEKDYIKSVYCIKGNFKIFYLSISIENL